MQASDGMTRNVVVVAPELTLDAAWQAMQLRRIRHLPVVVGGRLVGILSDRDVLVRARLEPGGALAVPRMPVGEAMTSTPITCEATTSVRDLVRIMVDEKIDALPVLTVSGRLVGLVTSTDLLGLLVDGEASRALPFEFRVEEHVAA